MMVDCARFNQKLVPVGEYVPGKSDVARFAVEGEKSGDEYPVVTVDKECTCYCQTCNKYVNLKKATASRRAAVNSWRCWTSPPG